MYSVLIVEDDRNIQNILAYNLEKADFKVFTAETGSEALEILQEDGDEISLVLMDVMMPEMNGFDATREIRKFSEVPIIMLTALEDETNILEGFDCGVNDYVVKPFSFRQVLARINAQLRHNSVEKPLATTPVNTDVSLLKVNNIELNPVNYSVNVDGKKSTLTLIEYNLFMFFYNHPNKVFDRDTLLKEVWGTNYADSRTVDVNIRRLRNKIELVDSDPQNIKTLRGKGYYLEMR